MSGRSPRDRAFRETASARLPLLDRLIDEAPETPREAQLSAAETVARLRRGVRRDLEALLNARRRWRSWPEGYAELAVSPVGYGIPDFTAGAFNEPARREALRAAIEEAIRRFEPRLARIRVRLIDNPDALEATLRLRIDALLRVDPAPEPIAFDTLIDAATAAVSVTAQTEGAAGTKGNV